ncbi:MAG: tellurium resistance protein TerC [Akkermansiaceae bacterium]|nr:tellurium resistance protein TerC [Akkermansiaceae bacterium]
MAENITDLLLLILLQAVLGFDNRLYISLESKRAPKDKQATVRRLGIGLAIFLRIILLFVVLKLVSAFTKPWIEFDFGWTAGSFNLRAITVLLGGVFILYTAIKEIFHLIKVEHLGADERKPRSVAVIVTWIVLMNLVFSFDSILSAMALTEVFWVMAVSIVSCGLLMIWLADRVAAFLEKNRMYEVLGLFILFVVGIMLITEGGHLAHLEFFGNEIHAMTKTTFYFVLAVLVISDIVQSRYQKKILARRAHAAKAAGPA